MGLFMAGVVGTAHGNEVRVLGDLRKTSTLVN
jgi:hypothetical protein